MSGGGGLATELDRLLEMARELEARVEQGGSPATARDLCAALAASVDNAVRLAGTPRGGGDIAAVGGGKLGRKRAAMEKVRRQVRVSSVHDLAPLDDGLSWRKYGQKDILGAKYPRSQLTTDLQVHAQALAGLPGHEAGAARRRRPAALRRRLPRRPHLRPGFAAPAATRSAANSCCCRPGTTAAGLACGRRWDAVAARHGVRGSAGRAVVPGSVRVLAAGVSEPVGVGTNAVVLNTRIVLGSEVQSFRLGDHWRHNLNPSSYHYYHITTKAVPLLLYSGISICTRRNCEDTDNNVHSL